MPPLTKADRLLDYYRLQARSANRSPSLSASGATREHSRSRISGNRPECKLKSVEAMANVVALVGDLEIA